MRIKISICILAGILAFGVHGAENQPPPTIDSATGLPLGPKVFDLRFPGGTAHQLVAALTEVSGKKPNLLLSPGTEKVVLPDLELRGVTTEQVFDALTRILRSQRIIFTVASAKGGEPIWAMHQEISISKTCKVFYVGDLLQKYKIEDITTAIQTAWKMEGGEGEVKFHQDTQLLIACATPPSRLNIITEILGELKTGISGAKPEAEKKKTTGSDQNRQ